MAKANSCSCKLGLEQCELRRPMAADLTAELPASQLNEILVGGFCVPVQQSTTTIYETVVPAETELVKLDVNQDGIISPLDIDLILTQIDNSQAIGPHHPKVEVSSSLNLDVDDDGKVTAHDASIVMNRVHWYNALVPCTCSDCLAAAVIDGST